MAGTRVAVIVLGDIGRSPRMQYHAASLRSHGAEVDLIGCGDTPLHPSLRDDPGVTTHWIADASGSQGRAGIYGLKQLFSAVWRFLRLGWQLVRTLIAVTRQSTILLVQNPPALPTLPIVCAVARWRSVPLIIDWHNFGESMLALRLGRQHPVVRFAGWIEAACGRLATAHLCVSRAMQEELAAGWRIRAEVLHDRPAAPFVRTPVAERATLFARLPEFSDYDPQGTPRPALIVSSTSWTPDEDFTLLVDALAQCDQHLRRAFGDGKPLWMVVITGRGALRPHYEEEFRRRNLGRVVVRTAWLSAEDYPLLIGSADVGLCLHRSASGFDLPMKVSDMLGAGLPVCAFDYGPCLRELIQPGVNGLLFGDAAGLAARLIEILGGFPTCELEGLRRRLAQQPIVRWDDEWCRTALPLFAQLAALPKLS